MERVGNTVPSCAARTRSPAVGLWLGLGLALAAVDRSSSQNSGTISCDETLSSNVVAGGTDDWSITSPGGMVRINTCSTGGDTKLRVSGVW